MNEVIPITKFVLGEKFKTSDAFKSKLKQYLDSNFYLQKSAEWN